MDRNSIDWKGYIPAITTPFHRDGSFDLKGLGTLLDWLASEGMHGLVLAGTTGEWFSMSPVERKELFQAAGTQLKGRLPLIAGCNAFTPSEVLDLADAAAEHGFDGLLITPPPYIVPREDEIFAFYKTISDGVRLPICVYNWPPGTNVDMSYELLERLASLEKVVAIKNSTSRLDKFVASAMGLREQVRVFGLTLDAFGAVMSNANLGDGTMGAAGVLGRNQPGFYDRLWAGDVEGAITIGRLDRVLMRDWISPELTGKFGSAQAIFKAALNVQGLPGGFPRAPLLPLDESGVAAVRATLSNLGRI
jgi:dihydrodipicolinate synthase/N-acetylneuraminate lyase